MSEWMLLRTGNDPYGNPRAVYVEVERGNVLQVVDMRHEGISAAERAGFDGGYTPALFFVTIEEYKHLRRVQENLQKGGQE